MKVSAALLSLALAIPLVGCKREGTPPGAKASVPSRAAAKGQAAAKRPAASGAVARIVFVDKEQACACTRERIDRSCGRR